MEKVLIVHHGRPHFEVALGLIENLRFTFGVHLWSNCLHVFGRMSLIQEINIPQYQGSMDYDYLIVVSGDHGPSESEVPPELWKLLLNKRVVRILHRYNGVRKAGEAFLFGRADLPFLPVLTGLNFPSSSEILEFNRPQLLVQGNIENRRNYSLLNQLALTVPSVDVRVCGLRVNEDVGNGSNIVQHTNLDEMEFHRVCAGADFIMPMIDPKRYSGYFKDRLTSSIQIGFAYGLPFIAHKALFEIYPIVGLSYGTDEEFIACVSQAADLNEQARHQMRSKMFTNRAIIVQKNIENLKTILADTPFGTEPEIEPAN